MNIKKQDIANYIITTEELKSEPDTISERAINALSHSSPNDWNWDNADLNVAVRNLKSYLQYLDGKLSSSRKTMTFWDVYNIHSAANSDNFIQNYSQLANNSSLVIKDNFTIGQETYKTGDIVVKDNYGNQIHIKNEQNGIYKPASFDNNVLTFEYDSNNSKGENPDISIKLQNFTAPESDLYNTNKLISSTDENRVITIPLKKSVYPFVEVRYAVSDADKAVVAIGDKVYGVANVNIDSENAKITITIAPLPFDVMVYVY